MARRKKEWIIVTEDIPGNDDQDKVSRGTIGLDGEPKAFMRSLFCIRRHCAVKYSQSLALSEQPEPLRPAVAHIQKGLDALIAATTAEDPADRNYYLHEWESQFLAAIEDLKGLPSSEPVARLKMAIADFNYYLASPDVCCMSAEHALCNVGNALLVARSVL